jgi:protein-tyrosine phosphatase
VSTLAATPHVRSDYPTDAGAMESGLATVREALGAAGVPLGVVAGGELDLEWLPRLDDDDLRRFSYGGAGRWVLLEIPDGGWPRALEPALARVREAGLGAVLAHPERNASVQARPGLVADLAAPDVVVQVTASALTGATGRSAQAAARALLRLGLVHCLASDAHGRHVRDYALADAAATIADAGLRRHLVEDAPAALLAGDTPSAAPRVRRRLPFGRW